MRRAALGVHLFMGGLSLGVRRHFDLQAHLEVSNFGVASWRRNVPDVPVHVSQHRTWPRPDRHVSFVYGNPPCSGFSAMTDKTRTTRGAGSHLNQGIRDVVWVGAELKADVIAVESVRLMESQGRPLLRELWDQVRDAYPASFVVKVNAFNHGVPQWRPRVFWLLSRTAGWRPTPPALPPPDLLTELQNIPAGAPNQERLDYRLEAGARAALPLLRPGQFLGDLPMELLDQVAPRWADRKRRWSRAALMHWPRRLDPAVPSCVVFGRELKYVHPVLDRLLTIREVARLMGVPDGFEIVGSSPSAQLVQMSKGVCPPVGAWLAREVAAFLDGVREPVRSGELLVYDDEPCKVQPRRKA